MMFCSSTSSREIDGETDCEIERDRQTDIQTDL